MRKLHFLDVNVTKQFCDGPHTRTRTHTHNTKLTHTKRNAKNLKLSRSKLKQLFCVRYIQDINDSLATEHSYVLNNDERSFYDFQ
jgi:hypothetical protein